PDGPARPAGWFWPRSQRGRAPAHSRDRPGEGHARVGASRPASYRRSTPGGWRWVPPRARAYQRLPLWRPAGGATGPCRPARGGACQEAGGCAPEWRPAALRGSGPPTEALRLALERHCRRVVAVSALALHLLVFARAGVRPSTSACSVSSDLSAAAAPWP